jgi:RNA polymerase sigma factor (sigma-70 family)
MPQADISFENLVDQYYRPLYRFALSLARNEDEAGDLTQQTFFIWAKKGSQLRDQGKAKSWLFTTLYREFLGSRRRMSKYPSVDLETADHELPVVQSNSSQALDAQYAIYALMQLDEIYRVPLALFYQESLSYQEIAAFLDLPIGTVMSRLSRGKTKLRALVENLNASDAKILPFEGSDLPKKQSSSGGSRG